MHQNTSIFERHSKTLSIFFCLSFLLFLSCGFNSQKNILSISRSDKNINLISQKSEPEMVVQKFMNYISDDDLEAANNLVVSDKERAKYVGSNQEIPSKFDWAAVFKEEKLSLKDIEDSKIIKDTAKVKVSVIHDNNSRIITIAIFELKNINKQWFIYEIEFITNKNEGTEKL